jgi:hypothetical protein
VLDCTSTSPHSCTSNTAGVALVVVGAPLDAGDAAIALDVVDAFGPFDGLGLLHAAHAKIDEAARRAIREVNVREAYQYVDVKESILELDGHENVRT